MLKAAIEKIEDLSKVKTFEIGGHTYSTKGLYEVKPGIEIPQNIKVYSLDALVQLIKKEALLCYDKPLFVEVFDHLTVSCFLSPKEDDRYVRPVLYTASASNIPGFSDRWMSYEEAMINLRSMFIPNEGTEYLLNLLANITDENSVNSEDNGVTQNVTVRKGIALQTTQQIKPIIKLKPYRTFFEVEQPESEFLVRVREGGNIGFFEADGGIWKLEARKTIKSELEYMLSDEIKEGSVVVML